MTEHICVTVSRVSKCLHIIRVLRRAVASLLVILLVFSYGRSRTFRPRELLCGLA